MRKSLLLPALLAALCAGCVAAPSARDSFTGDYLSARLAASANDVAAAAREFSAASNALQAQGVASASLQQDAFFYDVAAGRIADALIFARLELQSTQESESDNNDLESLLVAAADLKSGDCASAEKYASREIVEPFIKSVAHLTRVWIAACLDGPEAGLAALKEGGEEIFRGFDSAHEAILAEMSGNVEFARTAHKAAAEGFGGPVGRSAYGAFLERHGPADEAARYYEQMLADAGPARRTAELGLARLERGRASDFLEKAKPEEGAALGFYSFAGAMLEQAAMRRNQAVAAGFNVGDPQYNLPLALAQIALYLDPSLVEARRLIGSIHGAYGNTEEAARVLGAIPPASPHFEQARITIAASDAQSGRINEAIALMRKTVSDQPGLIEARLTLANLQLSVDDYEAAINAISGAIDRTNETAYPDTWRFYVTRGGALAEAGKWDAAEADLKKAVELAPNEPTALNYLGYSWAERGVNIDEAFDLIEKALAFEPNSGAITDSLGWAHYQRGEFDEAVIHLERAASLEPADPTITEHLGDAYWRLDRKIEAQFQWRRAKELSDSEELSSRVARKLKEGMSIEDAVAPRAERVEKSVTRNK